MKYKYCDINKELYLNDELIKKDYDFSMEDFTPLFGIVESLIPGGETVLKILQGLGNSLDYGEFMIKVYEEGTNYLDRLIKSESIRSQKYIDDLIGLTSKLDNCTKEELGAITAKIGLIKYMLSVSGSDRFDKVRKTAIETESVNEFRMTYFGDEDIHDMDKAGLGGAKAIIKYFEHDWKTNHESPFRDELKNSEVESLKESFDQSN